MRMMLSRDNLIYVSAIFLSIALSTWINLRETVINPDAICYVMAAQAYAKLHLNEVMHYCPQSKWPFYSILLDGLFTLISVVMFVKIIKALGGSSRVMWFALAVILLSHEFNSVRQYIVR